MSVRGRVAKAEAGANRKRAETGCCFARGVLTEQGDQLIGCLQAFPKKIQAVCSPHRDRAAGRRLGGEWGKQKGEMYVPHKSRTDSCINVLKIPPFILSAKMNINRYEQQSLL